jgi:hypothetical protein
MAAGLNVTPMVHLSPAPTLGLHVLLATAKSPLVATDDMATDTLR